MGFGFDELNARVQASELEILKCLQEEIVAIEIDGKWRGVDAEYRLHALAMMTASAFGNGWSTSALPTDAVVDAMASDGFAPEMARNTLHAFATKHDVDATWALDEEAVCRALAQRVLRDGAPRAEEGARYARLGEGAAGGGGGATCCFFRSSSTCSSRALASNRKRERSASSARLVRARVRVREGLGLGLGLTLTSWRSRAA